MTGQLVVDVSNNDPIGAGDVRASGCVALVCKATEGTSFLDRTYPGHREVAHQADVAFGGYLYLHTDSPGSEADYFNDYARPAPGDLPPIIDAEQPGVFPTRQGTARIDGCAMRLEQLGYQPLMYASASFWLEAIKVRPSLRRLRVWEAQYPGRFTRWFPALARLRIRLRHGANVVMWQWTDRYAIGGRHYDASRLMVPLPQLRIPKR